MVPRGEVGLIFAQMGLASAALTPRLFSAVTFMVLATTLLTPPLLGYLGDLTGIHTALLAIMVPILVALLLAGAAKPLKVDQPAEAA